MPKKQKLQPKIIKHKVHGAFWAFVALVGIATAAYHLPAAAAGQTSGVQTMTISTCTNPNAAWGELIKVGVSTSEITQNGNGYTIKFKAYPASGLPQQGTAFGFILDIIPDPSTDIGSGAGVSKRLNAGYADSTWFINGSTSSSQAPITATSTGEPNIKFLYSCGGQGTTVQEYLSLYIDAEGVHGGDQAASPQTGDNNGGSEQQQTTTPSQSAPKKATPKQTATPVAPPPANSGAPINLNGLDKFTTDGALAWMKQAQVGNLTVGGEAHTATVKEIGADYVVMTIASTPMDSRIAMEETKQYDVTGDSKYDFEITLLHIADGQAGLAFREISKAEQDAMAKQQTGGTKTQTNTTPSQTQMNWLWVIVPAAVAALALIALFAIPNVRTHFTMPLINKLRRKKK